METKKETNIDANADKTVLTAKQLEALQSGENFDKDFIISAIGNKAKTHGLIVNHELNEETSMIIGQVSFVTEKSIRGNIGLNLKAVKGVKKVWLFVPKGTEIVNGQLIPVSELLCIERITLYKNGHVGSSCQTLTSSVNIDALERDANNLLHSTNKKVYSFGTVYHVKPKKTTLEKIKSVYRQGTDKDREEIERVFTQNGIYVDFESGDRNNIVSFNNASGLNPAANF